jgi:predicted ATPase with chaperone activity
VTHGKGMFMFGPPGNGKTSLAERITRAYGSTIYIPHAIYAGGHIIQVYDPAVHVAVDESDIHPGMSGARVDRRWVRCRRPTVVVGGELTLEALDVAFDEVDGVCEAPIQVKANGGTLVIDDFGRQRCRPDELLNRWIVPLEKHVDYIALPGGRKEAFPFECLLIFSTNMEPRDLVDEAFLRRIPYKIEVHGPPEAHFRELVDQQCAELDLDVEEGAIDYLVDEYFTKTGRAMRYCHPRDLMLQVHNLCKFREEPGVVNKETIDQAVLLYFSLL